MLQSKEKIKILPHNIEAEICILGAMLLRPEIIPKVQHLINPDDFYREAHQNICKAIFDLKEESTVITVSVWIDKKGVLEMCGGADYIAALIQNTGTSAGVEYHAGIIKTLSKRRQIIAQCSITAEKCFKIYDDINQTLIDHKRKIREIESGSENTIPSNKQVLMGIMDDMEKGGDDHTVGVLTGLKNIDDNLNGLEPKTTYCLIAESGMAKSALALNIGSHIALNYPGKVLYFTLESTNTALVRRRLAKYSHIALTRLRTRNIYENEWETLTKTCNTLSEPNLIIIDSTIYQAIENLTAFCESLSMDQKISLIIIDYIQLIESKEKFNSRHLEISHISKQINFLAKDINVPILVISQLGKDVEKRKRKEPMLSDIKESGDIRNAMDNIISIYTDNPEDIEFYVKLTALKGKDTGRWHTWLNFNGNYQEFMDCADQSDDLIQKEVIY